MKLLNNILYTALIVFVFIMLWFVNINIEEEINNPTTFAKDIGLFILQTPSLKVLLSVMLLLALYGVWNNPPSNKDT